MKLPFVVHFLRPGDVAGVIFAALLLALVLFVSVKYPDGFAKLAIGWKFGPGWTCQHVASGEPVCIKDIPKQPAN